MSLTESSPPQPAHLPQPAHAPHATPAPPAPPAARPPRPLQPPHGHHGPQRPGPPGAGVDTSTAPHALTTEVGVVMIEGGTTSPFAGWQPAAAAVLGRSGPVQWFRTKGPRGRRSVPTRRAPDLSTWAEELAIATAGRGPVDLAACGAGGLVALRFTMDHPERVRRLLLVDVPSPYWWVKPRAHRSMRANPDRADVVIDLRTSLGAVTEQVLGESFGGQSVPALPDVAMASIRQPALFVRSPGAGLLTGGDHLARLLPNASLVVAHHDGGGCLVGDAGERTAGCGCGVVDTVARHFAD